MMMNTTTEIVQEVVKKSLQITFSWYDYTLFGVMLASSVLIGIYFGFFDKKQDTADEYLFGGRTMKVIPIALSLVASDLSGILILAIPADVYMFGMTYWLVVISTGIGCYICVYCYIPVYHNLGLTSIYKYLEMRFDGSLRTISSFLYLVKVFCYLPVVIYVPALALSQATGWNVKIITPILCGVCIFYTTIGGLKTVVWTDTLQLVVMVVAMIAVLVLGLISVGGVSEVYEKNLAGERLDINFDINPTIRDTFWSVLFGYFFTGTSLLAINQGFVQKFISLPTMASVRKSALYFTIGVMLSKTIVVIIGLIMYTKYYNCDPITSKAVMKRDQIMPFFVMDVAGSIPGLSGLFIAGVFCASLSTLSAYLNSLSGIVYEDFISNYVQEKISQTTVSNILKLLVVIIGIICTSLVYIVEHLGGVLPLVISITSMATGPLMGIFTLGLFFPKANTKGALFGSLISFITVLTMVFGTQYYKLIGQIPDITKPLSVEGCDFAVNITTTTPISMMESPILAPWFFRISHYYYSLIGTCLTLIIGCVVSSLTEDKDAKEVDEKLLSPVLIWFRRSRGKSYQSVEQLYDIPNLYGSKKTNGIKN